MAGFDNVVVVILGGGAGTRLFPLTQYRSKPAVPLGGKYRLVDIPISNCINAGLSQIFVLTQFNSASLNRHISRTYRFSSFSTGFVEVLAAEQRTDSPQWFQGTADAVRQMIPHIQGWRVDTVLILAGDHLYRMDYRSFLNRHFQTNADVTVSVIPASTKEAPDFGLLKVDDDLKIIEFKEKPKGADLESMRIEPNPEKFGNGITPERPFLSSMGIYVFNYARLVELLNEDPTSTDFGREIIPSALGRYNVQAHLFDQYWEDIGSIRAFFNANLDLASRLPKFNFFDAESPIYTRSRYLPPSKIHNCDISDTMVSEGCILSGVYARNSIIGLRSRIDQGVRLENAIVMGSDFFETIDEIGKNVANTIPHIGIGENSIVRRAIIDKNARIGKNVQLINQRDIENEDSADGSYFIREGIIIVAKNALIPDSTII